MKLIRAFGRWVRSFMRSQPSGIVAGVCAVCVCGFGGRVVVAAVGAACWQRMRGGQSF